MPCREGKAARGGRGRIKAINYEDDLLPHLIRVITINIDGAPVAPVYCRSLRSLAALLASDVISDQAGIFDRPTSEDSNPSVY